MAAFNYKQEYERYKKYYLSLEPLFNKPANRAYTAVIFSFLAVSLFGWYAIRPTMQTIFMLKREISDKTEVDKEMEDKISALIEAQAAFENIQQSIPFLSQALPMYSDPIGALAQLRGVAADSGLQIVGVSIPPVPLQNPTPKINAPSVSKVASVPFLLSVRGPYPNVKQFLINIGNLRRITQITDMTFTRNDLLSQTASPSGQQQVTGTLVQVDLKLNVFYQTL